ncbi:MAG TPA: response regulator transcription factor [Dongiaceae bacterium]|jgi:DNA-binding response OmpR family regulator|nr:response regulator transcription factor [Dongiaceae bacterium]
MRVLLIEDNERLSELTARGLLDANFAVDCMGTGEDALAAVAGTRFDAIILDLGLPDQDGLEVLRAIRDRNCPTPILILTARERVSDRVAGLNNGADDYLVKPFAMEELVARIKALLRRPGGALGMILTLGNVRFDTTGPQAEVGEHPVRLSRRELALLELLLRRANKVVSRRVLEESLYSFEQEIESNALEASVSRLRRKLELAKATIDIHTVRGVGYMVLEADDAASV